MLVPVFVKEVNKLFAAQKPIEKVSTLEVWDYGKDKPNQFPSRVRFAELLIPGCEKGDILDVQFGFQVSNNLNYPVEVSWRVLLTKDSEGYMGIPIAPGRGYNLPPEVHHGPGGDCGRIEIPEDGDWYVVIMLYGGGSSFSQLGDTLQVDVGYGSLTAMRS